MSVKHAAWHWSEIQPADCTFDQYTRQESGSGHPGRGPHSTLQSRNRRRGLGNRLRQACGDSWMAWGELIEGVLQTEASGIPTCHYDGRGGKVALGAVSFHWCPHIDSRRRGKNDIYRIGLRRVSEYEQDFEFAFVLSRIRTPFEPSESDRETMLYHLFNLAWHFRRRFIEHHKRRMEDLADLQESYQRSGRRDEFASELHDAVRSPLG